MLPLHDKDQPSGNNREGVVMRSKFSAVFFLLIFFVVAPRTTLGYDWGIGENVNVNLKGDLTYAAKLRTENPYAKFVTVGSPFFVSGDANFKKWELANNSIIGTVEVRADVPHFTFFGRMKGFYDNVYDDKDKYNKETREHAAYNFTDAAEYYLEGKFGNFTSRVGRQIVQWGESTAPVWAPGVNVVSPFFTQKVSSAGYTFRDWQVPSHIAWVNYEFTQDFSAELVYAPDFDPRFYLPVVGTFASPMDVLGFGADSAMVDDQRPTKFEDQQQYGGAIRMIIPSLNMFELGIYYYHYLNRFPMMTMPKKFPPSLQVNYPELDMVGLSFSHAIQAFDLNWQVNGELAYRPNDPMQKDLAAPFIAHMTGYKGIMPSAGGWERANTLTWVFGGMKFLFDVLDFTPWTFMLTPVFEFYGKINLDYTKEKLFTDPMVTAYYMLDLPLMTSDMIDNTALTLEFQSMGAIFPQKDSLHHLIFTTKARYGDHWEVLLGYDLVFGDPKQDPQGTWMWDRDALTFKLTYHFI